MSTGHTFHARDGARDRARGVFFVSGRCRRRVVGGVFGSSTEEELTTEEGPENEAEVGTGFVFASSAGAQSLQTVDFSITTVSL